MGVQTGVVRKGSEYNTNSQHDGGVLLAVQESLAVQALELPEDQIVQTLEACLQARFDSATAGPAVVRYKWQYCGPETMPPYKFVCCEETVIEVVDGPTAKPILVSVEVGQSLS